MYSNFNRHCYQHKLCTCWLPCNSIVRSLPSQNGRQPRNTRRYIDVQKRIQTQNPGAPRFKMCYITFQPISSGINLNNHRRPESCSQCWSINSFHMRSVHRAILNSNLVVSMLTFYKHKCVLKLMPLPTFQLWILPCIQDLPHLQHFGNSGSVIRVCHIGIIIKAQST
jgi:hypothetical protein